VDLSEQISTAGMEASGTGNMKMALNGAVTIGTLDGANVEIRERVGDDNFFLFGHTTEQLAALNRSGYHPMPWLESDSMAREAIDLIGSGHFSEGDRDLFHPLLANLCSSDPFRVMADLGDYRRAQNEVDTAWTDSHHGGNRWATMSVLNTARCGFFSSDRSIREYAERIWKVEPVQVKPSSTVAGLSL
jgi:starch phosphorylase